MYRTIRVDLKTYARLAATSGKLQLRLGRRVSLSDTIDYLICKQGKTARAFWSNLKEKRAKGRAGRGPRLHALASSLAPAVAQPTGEVAVGHRREIA